MILFTGIKILKSSHFSIYEYNIVDNEKGLEGWKRKKNRARSSYTANKQHNVEKREEKY